MFWALLCSVMSVSTGGIATPPPNARCCISEPFPYSLEKNPDLIRKRFEQYNALGVDIIRIHVFPDAEDPAATYAQVIKDYPFRLKVVLLNLPKEADFQLTDQNGALSREAVDYWNPEARRVVEARTVFLLERLKSEGLLDRTEYVIPFMGPAGEAIYPHPWTTGLPDATFWCYGRYAQEAFRNAMREKYHEISAADAAWGTTFGSWEAVKVLPPGTQPGTYWEDVLIWYRESKRDFVRWSIDMVRRHTDKPIILYLPGTHVTEAGWKEAVKTGKGDVWIKIMTDTEYLIDLAAEKGCVLQYTGVDTRPEADYVAAQIRRKNYRYLRVWGENAGDWGCAKDPLSLADTVIHDGFWGLDYTHAHFVFEKDGITPGNLFPQLREAYARIRHDLPHNAVVNGDFALWDHYKGGVTTTSQGVAANSIPLHWYGGPGAGATATYDVVDFPQGQTAVPGNPKRHLRVTWSVPPSKAWGEGQHQGIPRYTFLEYFGIQDVRRFSGETVTLSFYARVSEGELRMVPIAWHSYDPSTPGIAGIKGKGYELFDASGTPGTVTVAQGMPNPNAVCLLTSNWQRFEKIITLPDVKDKSITPGHYTGIGFDLYQAFGPVSIDIADVQLERGVQATPFTTN